MDLSQQELPLTAHFARGRKGARTHTDSQSTDSQSVARSSKRRKSNTSPLGSSARKSKLRVTTPQLPTPTTSTRKRTRNGRLEFPAKVLPTPSSSSIEQNVISLGGEEPAELELPQSLPEGAGNDVPELSLVTPISGRRGTTRSIDMKFHASSRHLALEESGIPTPRTLSRRQPQHLRVNDDHSPSASSDHHLPCKPRQASPVPSGPQVYPLQHTACSTQSPPRFPVDSDCPDPFYAQEKSNATMQRHDTEHFIQSEALDRGSSANHAMPMMPVSSSQSQYLLHLDATPTRKRYFRQAEHVISSQTQEERELTLSTPHRPRIVSRSGCVSPGKYPRGHFQISRFNYSEREGPHVYTLDSKSIGSPTNSAGRSRSSRATKKALDEFSPTSPSPSRHERTTSHPSPSSKTRTPRRSLRRNSIENIPPGDDSLTESEPESDILQMIAMQGKSCMPGLPLREMNQIPRHSSVARDARPLDHCGTTECDLPGVEDDSATEAESDGEILHCVAEIGKKRPHDHRSEPSPTPHPVISPLVSPARSRIATAPLILSPTQFSTHEGSVTESRTSSPSTTERPQIPLESLPSPVRNFLRMFHGDEDESYAADFPESLRV